MSRTAVPKTAAV